MPSAANAAREILTGLHQLMAKRGSAQAKLDHVVDLIADAMGSEVCSIYLLREQSLELFATHGLNKEAVHVTRLSPGQGLPLRLLLACGAVVTGTVIFAVALRFLDRPGFSLLQAMVRLGRRHWRRRRAWSARY